MLFHTNFRISFSIYSLKRGSIFFLQLHWFYKSIWWNWHRNNDESSDMIYAVPSVTERNRMTWKDMNHSVGFLSGLKHITSPLWACFLFYNWGRMMLWVIKADNDRTAGSISRIIKHFLHTEHYCYIPCVFVKMNVQYRGHIWVYFILVFLIITITATITITQC